MPVLIHVCTGTYVRNALIHTVAHGVIHNHTLSHTRVFPFVRRLMVTYFYMFSYTLRSNRHKHIRPSAYHPWRAVSATLAGPINKWNPAGLVSLVSKKCVVDLEVEVHSLV